MVKSRCIGDKLIQPLIGNPYFIGYINPYGLGLEIMGVDRLDSTYEQRRGAGMMLIRGEVGREFL